MKRILTLFVIVFLCGCSSQYTLSIDENQVSEEIIFPVDKTKIHTQDMGPYLDLYSSETIDSLINEDIYVQSDSTKYVYDKKIVEENNQIIFTLNYTYVDNEISNSRFLNECFENKEIKVSDDKISIHLSGKYTCLNSDEDSVEFKIKTSNKIESSNLDYNLFTSDFIWKIDKTNVDNVDIELTVLTDKKIYYYGIRAIVIGSAIFILGFIAYSARKVSKRDDINEI